MRRHTVLRARPAHRTTGVALLVLAGWVPLACTPDPVPFAPTTERVSVGTADAQIDWGRGGSLSDDGRWVAFTTLGDVDPNDNNGLEDVYVRNPDDLTTRWMTPTPFGPPNGASYEPQLSGNGKNVTYTSTASNLSFWDSNGVSDVYFTNVLAGVPLAVSALGGTIPVIGNGASFGAKPDFDGNVIAFTTEANNLTTGDTNGVSDAVVRDMLTGQISTVSVAPDGSPGNGLSVVTDISGDGRYVAFLSLASNLVAGDTASTVDAFVRDRVEETTTRAGRGGTSLATVSDDGRYVTYASSAPDLVAGDTNGVNDVFRTDLVAGTTVRVSVAPDGGQYSVDTRSVGASNDGRDVLFYVTGSANPDFDGTGVVRDIDAATSTVVTKRTAPQVVSPTTLATPPDIDMPVSLFRTVGRWAEIALSGDGRAVAWTTLAVAPGDTNANYDVYRRWWRS